jgi:hypothetical protein
VAKKNKDSYPVKLGEGITIGKIKGNELRRVINIAKCTGVNCPRYEFCQEIKPNDPRCRYEMEFLETVYGDFVDKDRGIADVLNQTQLNMIGIHLIPLYQQFIRYKREIECLDKMTYVNSKGGHYLYPQLEAQARVIKLIHDIEEKMGLSKISNAKHGRVKQVHGHEDGGMYHGQKGSYEELEEE